MCSSNVRTFIYVVVVCVMFSSNAVTCLSYFMFLLLHAHNTMVLSNALTFLCVVYVFE